MSALALKTARREILPHRHRRVGQLRHASADRVREKSPWVRRPASNPPDDAWGNAVESTGTDANPYRYAGERFDADTGLIYLRARWYEPAVGRFVAGDTFAGQAWQPLSSNKYLYASGDPVGNKDPGGHVTLGETVASLGVQAVLGAALSGGITYYKTRNFEKSLYSAGVGAIVAVTLGGIISGVRYLGVLKNSLQVAADAGLTVDSAIIAADKLRYLTELDAGKALGFKLLGYTSENLPALDKMLRASLSMIESATKEVTQYGVKYRISIQVIGPNGKEGIIDIIWQVDEGSTLYRLVTAIPHPFT